MRDCHSASVVDIDQLSLFVELQVKFVGQFHIVAVALLVDLDDRGTSEMGLHVVGDSSRHEVGGNGAVVAVHLIPCSILVKLQFGAVVQAYLIGGSSEVPVDLCVGDGLSWEGLAGSCVAGMIMSLAKVATEFIIMHISAARKNTDFFIIVLFLIVIIFVVYHVSLFLSSGSLLFLSTLQR